MAKYWIFTLLSLVALLTVQGSKRDAAARDEGKADHILNNARKDWERNAKGYNFRDNYDYPDYDYEDDISHWEPGYKARKKRAEKMGNKWWNEKEPRELRNLKEANRWLNKKEAERRRSKRDVNRDPHKQKFKKWHNKREVNKNYYKQKAKRWLNDQGANRWLNKKEAKRWHKKQEANRWRDEQAALRGKGKYPDYDLKETDWKRMKQALRRHHRRAQEKNYEGKPENKNNYNEAKGDGTPRKNNERNPKPGIGNEQDEPQRKPQKQGKEGQKPDTDEEREEEETPPRKEINKDKGNEDKDNKPVLGEDRGERRPRKLKDNVNGKINTVKKVPEPGEPREIKIQPGPSAPKSDPKRKMKYKKIRVKLGKGAKASTPKGSCKVSKIVPSADGNSAVLFGTKLKKKGGCKMEFSVPKGSRLTLNCPQFSLHKRGCSREKMTVADKKPKQSTDYCKGAGPNEWKSSSHKVLITFERQKYKKNCGYNFVCQIYVTDKPRTMKMYGKKKDCRKKFHQLEKGEQAVVFSLNKKGSYQCTVPLKAPLGTILTVTCPLLELDGQYSCSEEVSLSDIARYGRESYCNGIKDQPRLNMTTVAHRIRVTFDKYRSEKKEKYCSSGFVCIATVVDWWDTANPTPNYDPEGYRYYHGLYKYYNTECPDKSTVAGKDAECRFRCSEDGDCPEFQYCCPNGCGRVCVTPKVKRPLDDCGCSVTFQSPSRSFNNYDETFPFYFSSAKNVVLDIALLNFVWESLKDIFTPASMVPYIIDSDTDMALLGRFDSSCQLQNAINKAFNRDGYVPYDLFMKKMRKIFVIVDSNTNLAKVSNQSLTGTFSTVCLITVGNITVPQELTDQLTSGKEGNVCHWSVDSLANLGSVAPEVESIINDGSCACPGESAENLLCAAEGETCVRDKDCQQPSLLCTRGTCTKPTCYALDVIDLKADLRHGIDISPDYPENQFYWHWPSYRTFHHSYDYFLDFLEEGNFDYMYSDFDVVPSYPGYYAEIAESYFPRDRSKNKFLMNHAEYHPFLKEHDNYYYQNDDYYNSDNHTANMTDNEFEGRKYQIYGLPEYAPITEGCCDVDYFMCPGVPGLCIINYKVCDGKPDCPYRYDESSEACAKRICGEGFFKCTSGECIEETRVCDGSRDCPDSSDEYCKSHSDCPPYRTHNCASGECIRHDKICDGVTDCGSYEDEYSCYCDGFRCNNGECESKIYVCNGYNDCSDGSDEYCNTTDSCPEDRPFLCPNKRCIYEYSVCNGFKHCSDGSDENLEMCFPDDCHYCPSGKCISKSLLCNGFDDCEDGFDESGCINFVCTGEKFQCSSGECLSKKVLCNGREECADGSDESFCAEAKCSDKKPFKCSSGECINYQQLCNGVYNCEDKSDESKCPELPCTSERSYKCQSGQCLNRFTNPRCNQQVDCIDGSDEINCEIHCSLTCRSGECYIEDKICDGIRDCPDGTDEENCNGVPCPQEKQLRCDSGECLFSAYWCDGDNDCRDGSDEVDCADFTCSEGMFKCETGECVYKNLRCDGYNVNCKDASDEKGCDPKKTCRTEMTPTCSTGECMKGFKFCDGFNQCLDSSDEENCGDFKCPPYRPFKCGSGECRATSYRCDGFVNCADMSDEKECKNFTCPLRRPYHCPNGICITTYQICNGVDDCGDGSDERDCDTFECPEEYFQCRAGNCINQRWVCNNFPNCPDGDDEEMCN